MRAEDGAMGSEETAHQATIRQLFREAGWRAEAATTAWDAGESEEAWLHLKHAFAVALHVLDLRPNPEECRTVVWLLDVLVTLDTLFRRSR